MCDMRFPADVPTLTSGDLTLRAHRIDDIGAIVEQCTDAESIRWTTVPLGYDRAMAETWVTTSIPGRWEDVSERVFGAILRLPEGAVRENAHNKSALS